MGESRIGMVLAPTFGERGSFVPLGLAQLNAVMRLAGRTPVYHDLSEWLRHDDPDFYAELVEIGFSPREGGFFGPDPVLLGSAARIPGVFHPLGEPLIQSVGKAVEHLGELDLVLMTAWDSNLPYVVALGTALRRKGVRVVCGGPGAALAPVRHALIRLGAADVVVLGEGEERLMPIVEALESGASLEAIAGLCLPDGEGGSRETPEARDSRIHDLPPPDFTGFPTDDWLPVLTSRGCIRDCSFCTERFVWARYRQRRVESVLDELEERVRVAGVRRFEFNDDLLNGHVGWLERFCDGIAERRLDIRWICFMEPYRLTAALLAKVAAAGCTLIKFGVQHLDREMLERIGRGSEIEGVCDVLGTAADLGMRVHFDLIPGHPGESEEQHRINCEGLPAILARSERIRVNVNPFLLLHGSAVEQNPGAHGVVVHRYGVEDVPALLSETLEGHLGGFIQSFEANPGEDVVATRGGDLEAIAHLSGEFRADATCHASAAAVRALTPREPGGSARLRLRVGSESTPRAILEAIGVGRVHGFAGVLLETPGAPCDRAEWVRLARREGLSGVVVDGTPMPEVSRVLAAEGMPWLVRRRGMADDSSGELAVIQACRQSGARGLHLALDDFPEGMKGTSLGSLQSRLTQFLQAGRNEGLAIRVTGIPACFIPDPEEHWATDPLVPVGGQRLEHLKRCGACTWEGRCSGAGGAWLEGEGEAVIRPITTRPRQGGGDDPIEQLLR